jgi:hypothetical protein
MIDTLVWGAPRDGLEDTRIWSITALQASGTIAISESPHDERLPGWVHRSGPGADALTLQAKWAFGSASSLAVLACRY